MANLGMIEPFVDGQTRYNEDGSKVISYGLSSYGYDLRVSDEFKVFTNLKSSIIDPKKFDSNAFIDVKGPYCIIPPNSFALAKSVGPFEFRGVFSRCALVNRPMQDVGSL